MTLSHKNICGAFKLLGLFLLMSVVGCTGTRINIPNVPEKDKEYDKTRGRTIIGEASGLQLLLFIPISVNGRQEQAYRTLLAQADGGFITDVQVKESWTYCFVGTLYRTTLTATVYPYTSTTASVQTAQKPLEERLKKLDELKASKIITEEEYNQKRKALLEGI
jgi:hypothetical protein